jgi:hypothetical protein
MVLILPTGNIHNYAAFYKMSTQKMLSVAFIVSCNSGGSGPLFNPQPQRTRDSNLKK